MCFCRYLIMGNAGVVVMFVMWSAFFIYGYKNYHAQVAHVVITVLCAQRFFCH